MIAIDERINTPPQTPPPPTTTTTTTSSSSTSSTSASSVAEQARELASKVDQNGIYLFISNFIHFFDLFLFIYIFQNLDWSSVTSFVEKFGGASSGHRLDVLIFSHFFLMFSTKRCCVCDRMASRRAIRLGRCVRRRGAVVQRLGAQSCGVGSAACGIVQSGIWIHFGQEISHIVESCHAARCARRGRHGAAQ
jgi:hypothetical protein